MVKEFFLKSRINSSNNQINFQLKKSDLPIKIKDKLNELKGIKIKAEDFDFDKVFDKL